jgi:hypothetical protein
VQKSIAGFITAPYERPTAYPGLTGAGTATQRDALPHSSSASASPVGGLGADTVLSGMGGVTSHNPGQHTNGSDRSGNQLLNTKGVAQVWGKKPDPPAPVPANGSKISPPNAPSPVMPTNTAAYPAYASYDQKESKKEKEVEEVREPSEREKMALALFGGMKPIASSSSMQKGGAVTAVSVSPTILIQPIPHKGPIKGSTGPDPVPAPVPVPIQTRTPDFMNLNPSPKHDSPFTSSSSPSSSSSSKLLNTNIDSHINGNGSGNVNGNGVGNVLSTSRSQSPNTPPLNPTMSSYAAVPLLVPVPVPSTPSLPVLTPLKITTQYFGQLWSQVGPSDTESSDGPALLEWKSACQCRVTTLERLRAVLPPHYGHIESIPATQEAIFASLVTTPPSSSSSSSYSSLDAMNLLSPTLALPHAGNGVQVNMVILIHIQLQVGNDTGAGKVEITVKSSSREVCVSTMQSLTSTLSSSY